MTTGEINLTWARTLIDELWRCGVTMVCLAPGSRSTSLVLAAAEHPGLRVVTHLDERSAAFFALGVGKATRVPAVIITTSGTATANLLPAVVEASQSGVPLILLTADRPHRLRGADANQAIDQLRLYGPFVRRFVDVAPPTEHEADLRHLRSLAGRAVLDASGVDPGPVHLNLPFSKPFQPGVVGYTEQGAGGVFGRPNNQPYTAASAGVQAPTQADVATTLSLLSDSRKGVIVAGPDSEPWRTGPAIRALSAGTGLPVLADPLSGAKFGPSPEGATILGSYDLTLRDPEVRARLTPDLVLRIGTTPTSASCASWLQAEASGAHQIVVASGGRWRDHLATATHYIEADPSLFCAAVTERAVRRGTAWRDMWARVDRNAHEAALQRDLSEPHVASHVVDMTPERAWLFVSNSMPIRDVDAFTGPDPKPLRVLGNRGASGIDGIVSTALGLAAGSGDPVVALLGDIALIHDMNGLLATRERDLTVIFVVIHNDGGGIFHLLPIREFEPGFTRHFATPHGLDFRQAAALYHLPYERVATPEDLEASITRGIQEGGSRVIEVRTDRDQNRIIRDRAAESVAAAVQSVLNQDEPE